MSLDNIMDEVIKKKYPTITEMRENKIENELDKNKEKEPSEWIREDLKELRIKNERLEIENERLKNENRYRDMFVDWTIRLVTIFLCCTGRVVVMNETLSDGIKITLLWTTTATIIGLPYVIVKGLFDNKDKK